MAFPFTKCQLPLDISLSEGNQIKSPELANPVDHGTSFLMDPNGSV